MPGDLRGFSPVSRPPLPHGFTMAVFQAFPLRRAQFVPETHAQACAHPDGFRHGWYTGQETRHKVRSVPLAGARTFAAQQPVRAARRLWPDLSSSSSINSEKSPLRPRAHASRQASSCSLKTWLSISSCSEGMASRGSIFISAFRDSSFSLRGSFGFFAIHFCASAIHFARIAASISSAVCGSAASRSINLPFAPTRKSHSMRTPRFSSGM
jgi:hypothetical protein